MTDHLIEGRYTLGAGTALAPTPVVMISTHGTTESGEVRDNLAAVAWTGIVCSKPPQISVSLRPSRLSYAFLKKNPYFAVNLVDKKLTETCDWTGVVSGRDHDKFKARQLDSFDCPEGKIKAVADSPLVLFCKAKQAIPLGSHELFIADILNVYAREDLVDQKAALHLERAELVAYAHGAYFSLDRALGFFGYSVAREDVKKRRLSALRVWPEKQAGKKAKRSKQ